MPICQFVPGSELFRRKLSVTMFDDKYDKFFITLTLDNDAVKTFDCNSQYNISIKKVMQIIDFFDAYFIITEIQPNTSNVHYHIMGCLLKAYGYLSKYKSKFIDAPEHSDLYYFVSRKIRDKIENFGIYKDNILDIDTRIIHSKSPFTDIKVLTPSQDFVSYLHKDLDYLYQMTSYKNVRFIMSFASVDDVKNLQSLIHFKKV